MLKPILYIDGDSCPVKTECMRVAKRYDIETYLVSNSGMRTDPMFSVKNILVGPEFDAADNWIVEHIGANDIVVTSDIHLVSRCLKLSALVLNPSGKVFSPDTIGTAVAMRDLHAYLREAGEQLKTKTTCSKNDRAQFLQKLDLLIGQAIKKYESAEKN